MKVRKEIREFAEGMGAKLRKYKKLGGDPWKGMESGIVIS